MRCACDAPYPAAASLNGADSCWQNHKSISNYTARSNKQANIKAHEDHAQQQQQNQCYGSQVERSHLCTPALASPPRPKKKSCTSKGERPTPSRREKGHQPPARTHLMPSLPPNLHQILTPTHKHVLLYLLHLQARQLPTRCTMGVGMHHRASRACVAVSCMMNQTPGYENKMTASCGGMSLRWSTHTCQLDVLLCWHCCSQTIMCVWSFAECQRGLFAKPCCMANVVHYACQLSPPLNSPIKQQACLAG